MDCPFCNHAIENAVFGKTEYSRAIYNISPLLPGHSLIVPERHVSTPYELTSAEFEDLMFFMRDVSKLLRQAYDADGINWTLQEGEPAGQTISHLHFHLIPRNPADFPDPGDWYPKLKEHQNIDSARRPKLTPEQMKEIVEWLREKSRAVNLWK